MLISSFKTWPIFLKNKNKALLKWNAKGGRTSNGRVLTHTKSSRFSKHKVSKITISKQLLISPFFIFKKYIKALQRPKALIMFPGGATSIVPSNNTSSVGTLYIKNFYETTQNLFFYNTVAGFGYGAHISFLKIGNYNLASSLGAFCTVVFSYLNNYVLILPSGFLKVVNEGVMCIAYEHGDIQFRKFRKGARVLSLLGRKSTVRGIAKNPNDHPHGGRTNTVLRPKTPWGLSIRKSKINFKIIHNLKKKQENNSLDLVEITNIVE